METFMIKISFVCVLSLIVAACSPATTPAPAPISAPVAVQAPQADLRIDRPKFSIVLPGFQERAPNPDQEKIEGVIEEFTAASTAQVGSYPVIVTLDTFDLSTDDDSPEDDEFGRSIAFLTMKEYGDSVILAKEVKSDDGLSGSVVVYGASETESIEIIQLAVGYDRSGYVLRCAGDGSQPEALARRCKAVLSGFHINKK